MQTKNTCGHPELEHCARSMCRKCWEKWHYHLPETKARTKCLDKMPHNIRLAKHYRLKNRFGISVDDHDDMILRQNNLCAICHQPEYATHSGKIRNLSVDHDHATGVVRGLLCQNCNSIVGHAKDNVETLRSAITYLESAQICASLS